MKTIAFLILSSVLSLPVAHAQVIVYEDSESSVPIRRFITQNFELYVGQDSPGKAYNILNKVDPPTQLVTQSTDLIAYEPITLLTYSNADSLYKFNSVYKNEATEIFGILSLDQELNFVDFVPSNFTLVNGLDFAYSESNAFSSLFYIGVEDSSLGTQADAIVAVSKQHDNLFRLKYFDYNTVLASYVGDTTITVFKTIDQFTNDHYWIHTYDTSFSSADSVVIDEQPDRFRGIRPLTDSTYIALGIEPDYDTNTKSYTYQIIHKDSGTVLRSNLWDPRPLFQPNLLLINTLALSKDLGVFVGAAYLQSGLNIPYVGTLPLNRVFKLAFVSSSGELRWEKTFGGDANYILSSVTTDSAGNCIAMGSYYDWQTNPDGKRDIFILKLDPNGNVITSTHEALATPQTAPLVFPNPASTRAHIRWPTLKGGFDYSVRDALGKTHLNGQTLTNAYELDVSMLSSGLYFVELQAGDARHSLRLMRE